MKSGHDILVETLQDDPVPHFEFYALRTRQVLDGERALMLAVLVDALDTYVKTRHARGHRKRAEFREVSCWMRSNASASPFAFEVVCEGLGINPDAVRSSLSSPRSAERRTIRHFRHIASNTSDRMEARRVAGSSG
jgi:hypothetical protein